MKDHVTDLQTSKRLREAGVAEPSKHRWLRDWAGEYICRSIYQGGGEFICNAYLLSELLEMVREGKPDGCAGLPYLFHFLAIIRNWLFDKNTNLIQAVAEAIIYQGENK